MVIIGLLSAGFAAVFCYIVNVSLKITVTSSFENMTEQETDLEFKNNAGFRRSRFFLYLCVPLAYPLAVYFDNLSVRYLIGASIAATFIVYFILFQITAYKIEKKSKSR